MRRNLKLDDAKMIDELMMGGKKSGREDGQKTQKLRNRVSSLGGGVPTHTVHKGEEECPKVHFKNEAMRI